MLISSKKVMLFRLLSKLFIFSLIGFVSAPKELKLNIIRSYFRFLTRENTLGMTPFEDLDSEEKCIDFLSKTKMIFDEDLDDEIMYRITHARHFLGLDDNSFRLKRLRLAGVKFNELIDHLKRFDELKNLAFEFFAGEGRRSLGLILHGKPKIRYITKVIKDIDSYYKEVNFYSSIRSLGSLSTITPNLILSSQFKDLFLITLEYIDSQSNESIISNHMIMNTFSIVSNINTKDYVQLLEDIYIDRPYYFSNIYLLKRLLYKNLIHICELTNLDINRINPILSLIKSIKLDKIVWSLNHDDHLSWNYKHSSGKLYIIDWENYSLDVYGKNFLGYVIRNKLDLRLIEEFMASELENTAKENRESFIILLILLFSDVENYIIKHSFSGDKELEIISHIFKKSIEILEN